MNDLKVKVVQPKVNKNLNSYKVKTDVVATKPIEKPQIQQNNSLTFKVGTKVKHKEEGIVGEIKFVGNDKVAVVWADNTRERFALSEAKDCLDYVDNVQTQVAPLAPQISKTEEKEDNETDNILDKALASLDEELDDDGEPIQKVDLEKVKLQRENEMLKNAKISNATDKMKEKVARELIEVAIRKGMIDADDLEQEIVSVMLLDDHGFEDYKQSVIDYESDGSEVTSGYEPDNTDYSGMTKQEIEAAKLLKKIQKNGGKGIIGDFNKGVAIETKGDADLTPKRSLADLGGGKKFSWDAESKEATKKELMGMQSFEYQVADELIANLQRKGQQREIVASPFEVEDPQLDLSGFQNLAGIKKPLRVADKPVYAAPTNTGLKDLFSDFDWKMGPR